MGFIFRQKTMAQSGYISANLTAKQLQFIKLLDEHEVEIFSIDNIEKKLHKQFPNLNEIMENLVHKKILSRIERGKFCKANFRDEWAIANLLTPDAVVAYWSALNLHGYTEQISNAVFVQTAQDKKAKKIFGVQYRFIKIGKHKQLGIIKKGFGNHQYRITDVEKTIVDCFDIPRNAGGYDNLIKAFYRAPLSAEKLIAYCEAAKNISEAKRMAVIAEVTGKKGLSAFMKYAAKKVNLNYDLFNPFGQRSGELNKKWMLRMNLSEEKIKHMCQTEF